MRNKDFITVLELSKLMGISRIAVFKKIKKGQIKAVKIGRNYAIPINEVQSITGSTLNKNDKITIDNAINGTIKEYGETLRLLGKD